MRSAAYLLLLMLLAGCGGGSEGPSDGQAEPRTGAFTSADLEQIERELQIKLPQEYRRFMLARSAELVKCTYSLRGKTEFWFDSSLFGLNIEGLIAENLQQRQPDMAAGQVFPGWWKEYFFFGTNGGGDYYALRLDGKPGVWFIDCDGGRIRLDAPSLDKYVNDSLEHYRETLVR